MGNATAAVRALDGLKKDGKIALWDSAPRSFQSTGASMFLSVAYKLFLNRILSLLDFFLHSAPCFYEKAGARIVDSVSLVQFLFIFVCRLVTCFCLVRAPRFFSPLSATSFD